MGAVLVETSAILASVPAQDSLTGVMLHPALGANASLAADAMQSRIQHAIERAARSLLAALMVAAAVLYFGALWAAGLKLRQMLRR